MANNRKPPLKELKMQAKPDQKASKQMKKDKQPEPTLNDPKEWERIHKENVGISNQITKLGAYSDRLLKTDEDLPLLMHIQLFMIIFVIIAFIVWANFATLDEITRGQGKVIPSSEVQVIQHQEGGTVQSLMVRENQRVDAGQILMRLSDVGATSELGSTQARMMGMQAKTLRLQAEAEGKPTLDFSEDMIETVPQTVQEELNTFRANKSRLDSQKSVLQSQISQRRAEVSEINTRINDLNRVISLTNEEMSMIRPLVERGSAPRRDLLTLEQTLAQQQSELNGLRSSLPRVRAAVQEAQARLSDIDTTFRSEAQNELTNAMVELKSLQQQMPALQDRRTRTEIRSPVNGIVKDIRVSTDEGSGVIRPGDAIMEVVPIDDQLVVEADIMPSDVAFLHPGQKAVVKITAYDFSIYGGLEGQLTDISADTFTNEQGESFYKIRVTTNENTIERNGEQLPIIPGMVASVDILTGEKTVMQYIMKPLIKSLSQAMNER
jgi:adhesin transport system membrane fusion protein